MHDTIDRPPATAADASDLPESYDIHWSQSRKAEVVRAVRDKLISFDEARWRYLLSRREFRDWQRDLSREGHRDLQFDLADAD